MRKIRATMEADTSTLKTIFVKRTMDEYGVGACWEETNHSTHRCTQTARELEDGEEDTVVLVSSIAKAYTSIQRWRITLCWWSRVPQSASSQINTLGSPENGRSHTINGIAGNLNIGSREEVGRHNDDIGNTPNHHGLSRESFEKRRKTMGQSRTQFEGRTQKRRQTCSTGIPSLCSPTSHQVLFALSIWDCS